MSLVKIRIKGHSKLGTTPAMSLTHGEYDFGGDGRARGSSGVVVFNQDGEAFVSAKLARHLQESGVAFERMAGSMDEEDRIQAAEGPYDLEETAANPPTTQTPALTGDEDVKVSELTEEEKAHRGIPNTATGTVRGGTPRGTAPAAAPRGRGGKK